MSRRHRKNLSPSLTHTTKKWVLDADIKGAFDNISHDALQEAIGPVPGRELIRQWLKAGYVEQEAFHPTKNGTPQGGVISPLLANIALHGMENAIGVQYNCRGEIIGKRAVVRYADDFVCFCETKEDAEQVRGILVEWFKQRGLTLSPEKTQIVHLTERFDFLGFNVRHYHAPQTARSGWKLLIKPSKESVQKIRNALKDHWKVAQGASIQTVLATINPVIRGWAEYFRVAVAKEIFGKLDRWMFYKANWYTKRKHPNKSKHWQRRKYWGRFNLDREDYSTFGDKQTGRYLLKFSWFPIERHVLVKGTSSPDDPKLSDYWAKRQAAKACDLTLSKQKLAERQNGRCLECFESFFNGEEIQVHHHRSHNLGRKNGYSNFVLVHLLCHQQIHAKTQRAMNECQQDNDRKAPINHGRAPPQSGKEEGAVLFVMCSSCVR